MKPVVSVLLPVYNGMPFLPEAVECILQQTLREIELIIIDDGSTDESYAVAKAICDPRVRVEKNERNLGLPGTLNRGLEMARAPLIARQDQDDWSDPRRLETQAKAFAEQPEAAAVFCDAQLMDAGGRYRGRIRSARTPRAIRWDLCFRNTLPHSAAMFRRQAVWDELGGYRELPNCEDYDLWSRLAARHEVFSLAEPLQRYRVHASSMMGRDHAERAARSREPKRAIMRENMRVFLGEWIDTQECSLLASAWLDEEFSDWERYFLIRHKAWRGYVARHGEVDGFRTVLADEDYTLFFSMLRRGRKSAHAFLSAMMRSGCTHLRQMPWVRMLGAYLTVR